MNRFHSPNTSSSLYKESLARAMDFLSCWAQTRSLANFSAKSIYSLRFLAIKSVTPIRLYMPAVKGMTLLKDGAVTIGVPIAKASIDVTYTAKSDIGQIAKQ